MAITAPQMSPEDSALQFKVRLEMRIHPKTEAFAKDLKICVRHSTAILDGEVSSEIDAKNAERIALTVPGVAGVVNNIKVS